MSETNVDIHDCGFVIYAEESTTLVGVGTPDSRKNRLEEPPTVNLAMDASGHILSSPASSLSHGAVFDDKENVPPTPYASSSTDPSPSKYTSSAKSTPSHTRFDEEEVFFSPASRRRTIERSKLGTESVLRGKDKVAEPEDDDTDEEDELTPGKTVVDRSKGKARMSRELDKE